MKKSILYKIDKVAILLIFLLSIYIPFIGSVVQEDKAVSYVEKRNLAKLPSFPQSLTSFIGYPESFNTYYSDNFGFREELTKAYFKFANKLSNKTSVDDVTMGKNGWLFLGSIKPGYGRYNDPIGDAINANLYTEEELREFARSISKVNDWLKSKGIKYIYIIAPNKHTIYFEYLPEYISKINDTSSTDQLVRYLREHTDIVVVDLRKALLKEKKTHQVYFKNDTHWNHYGANVAQYEILKRIQLFFPTPIEPYLLSDNQFKITSKNGGDLAGIAKIKNLTENNPQPIFEKGCLPTNENPGHKRRETHTMECKNKKLNAVIFRDSFFSALQPYISRQFHRSTYIWKKINYVSLAKYIEQEKPDIVIEEVVERSLPYIPNSSSF